MWSKNNKYVYFSNRFYLWYQDILFLFHKTEFVNFACFFDQFLDVLGLFLGRGYALLDEADLDGLTSGLQNVTNLELSSVRRCHLHKIMTIGLVKFKKHDELGAFVVQSFDVKNKERKRQDIKTLVTQCQWFIFFWKFNRNEIINWNC